MDTAVPREAAATPNPLPRPPEELERLEAAWRMPRGLALLTEYNNNLIGPLFVATALLFFVLAGVLASSSARSLPSRA
jgi:cytochrome c oxidase subunit I+III